MLRIIFLLTATLLAFSCKKEDAKAGETVEIYLLKSYQLVTGKCQVEPLSAILEETATVTNRDILEYSKREYQFKLSDEAMQKVKAFKDRTTFAVVADKKVIYYGFFKPATSSSSCEHSITMDIGMVAGNTISLKLGYPGASQSSIDDQRNNPVLMATLKNRVSLDKKSSAGRCYLRKKT